MSLLVKSEEWPHGLRCMDCHRELIEGDIYTERLEGMIDDTPLVEIICSDCELKNTNA